MWKYVCDKDTLSANIQLCILADLFLQKKVTVCTAVTSILHITPWEKGRNPVLETVLFLLFMKK